MPFAEFSDAEAAVSVMFCVQVVKVWLLGRCWTRRKLALRLLLRIPLPHLFASNFLQ